MAYSLHITRKYKSNGSQYILLSEWEELVSKIEDLEIQGSVKAKSPTGDQIEISGDSVTVWKQDMQTIYLRYYNGSISVDGPNDFGILQMQILALRLDAEVRGDEGELYEIPEYLKSTLEKTKVKLNNITKKISSLKIYKLLDSERCRDIFFVCIVIGTLLKVFWIYS